MVLPQSSTSVVFYNSSATLKPADLNKIIFSNGVNNIVLTLPPYKDIALQFGVTNSFILTIVNFSENYLSIHNSNNSLIGIANGQTVNKYVGTFTSTKVGTVTTYDMFLRDIPLKKIIPVEPYSFKSIMKCESFTRSESSESEYSSPSIPVILNNDKYVNNIHIHTYTVPGYKGFDFTDNTSIVEAAEAKGITTTFGATIYFIVKNISGGNLQIRFDKNIRNENNIGYVDYVVGNTYSIMTIPDNIYWVIKMKLSNYVGMEAFDKVIYSFIEYGQIVV